MLHQLLKLVGRAVEVRPSFHAPRCLAVRQSPAACRRCAEVCPHEAVTVRASGVTIDEVDCTGCGLCVQACPSEALEPTVRIDAGRSVKCSRVAGDATTVTCLARLRATDLHGLVRGRDEVVLARGDCAACDIGGRDVPAAVERTVADASELLRLRGSAARLNVEVRERLDDDASARTLDRRALLRGGFDGMARGAATVLAPLDPGSDEDANALPEESARRLRALTLADLSDDERVPWPVPEVDDRCILCPVCTRICPTDAFSRVLSEEGGGELRLDPARCIGCDACVDACPVDAIAMERRPAWGDVRDGPRSVAHRDGDASDGAVPR